MKATRPCPRCGSGSIRLSRHRNLLEKLGALLGFQMVRCRDCRARFADIYWRSELLLYAKCPRCHELELTDWQEKYNYPPWYQRAFLYVGARPHRCPGCRLNFVSFRRRWAPTKKYGSK